MSLKSCGGQRRDNQTTLKSPVMSTGIFAKMLACRGGLQRRQSHRARRPAVSPRVRTGEASRVSVMRPHFHSATKLPLLSKRMRHLALLVIFLLAGCYSMQTERVLVLDSASHTPVAGVRVFKKPVHGLFSMFDLGSRLRPLPGAAEGVSDENGMLALRVPRDQWEFLLDVGSDDYEYDLLAREPTTRPAHVDAVYQVRPRLTTAR